MPLLTIAIPTYNRHESLRTTLQALRAQAREEVELIVVDNCSTPPVEAVVQDVLKGSEWSYRVVRNPVNVGLCANILRCFEVAQAEWLWVLGDDDVVNPSAVGIILRTIQDYPDLLFATYSQQVAPNHQDLICDSVDSFFLALQSFPQLIFISTSLYHRGKLIQYLNLAYNFIDSGGPHPALLLLAGLDEQRRHLAFLSSQIVSWQPPASGQSYSPFSAIGQHRLLALCRGKVRKHLASLLLATTPSPMRLIVHLTRDASNGRELTILRAILNQYLESYGHMRGGLIGFAWAAPIRHLFQLMLSFPKPATAVFNLVSRLIRGKSINYDTNPVSINSYLRLSEIAQKRDEP